ncbi:MAG: DUF433 domain-containing protein [Isosphaeraceae bacterium]|nr:DUF433 domain-containing protein [Isosphaeraceae bacterium]
MEWQDRIVVDPGILVGRPVVRGTRLSVEFLLGLMAQGWPEVEILHNYPGLAREDLLACLDYAPTLRRHVRRAGRHALAALQARHDWAGQFAVVEPGRICLQPLPGAGT